MIRQRQNGFTLIEMLLSVGIIAMLAGLSLPVYLSFTTRNDLAIITESTANALRRAQTYSRGVREDSQWGVAVQPTQIVLFKGTSYATRDAAFDEPISLPGQTTASGLAEVTFNKGTAWPNTTGSIAITSDALNETRTVTINAKGMVSY